MDSLFKGFFQGKTVFITGHTGFKGSWLSAWLDLLGARVVGYALPPPTDPSLFDIVGLESKVRHIQGDVRDARLLNDAVTGAGADIVFHLAAQPLVGDSYQDPLYTFETNILGTANLLDAVRRSRSVRVCQVITSDKCYENREWVYAYRETDRLGGADPYSSSKACAELVTEAFRESYFSRSQYAEHGLSLSSVRAGNVIGGGDWARDRLVPDCVRALAEGRELLLRSPEAIRPWQHVLDCLSGYLWLAVRMWERGVDFGSAWNFGPDPGSAIPVQDLVHRLTGLWGRPDTGDPGLRTGASHLSFREAGYLKLDCTKAFSYLNWRPVLDLDEALDQTAQWYRTYYGDGKGSMASWTRDQISRYVEKAREARAVWAVNN